MKKSILVISVLLAAVFMFAGCVGKNAKQDRDTIADDEMAGLEELNELEELEELEFLEELEELEKLIEELEEQDE